MFFVPKQVFFMKNHSKLSILHIDFFALKA